MKTPKAEKLPSGSWRIKIQVDGKRYSCTGATKKEAQEKAAKIYAGFQMEKRSPLTVGKAIDNYISSIEKILSPTTLEGYRVIRRNYLKPIMDLQLSDLTNAEIKNAIAQDSLAGRSDKTLRNAHGLLSATLAEYRPDFVSHARIPKHKKKKDVRIPTEDELQRIWNEVKGSKYELPILLASWLGLRKSEIKGLKFSDVENGTLHIQRAVVKSDIGYTEKAPKTASGNRCIRLPEPIEKLIRDIPHESDDEYIVKAAPNTIYNNFIAACKRANVEPCRFHDLRHFAASEAHSLGVPDKYIVERMGHATDNMLKTVYEHAMKDKVDKFAKAIDEHMTKLYNGESETAPK